MLSRRRAGDDAMQAAADRSPDADQLSTPPATTGPCVLALSSSPPPMS